MQLERGAARVLLGQRVAEGVNDARALAASIVAAMPEGLREAGVREFLGWIQGSSDSLVRAYEHAAMIRPQARLSDLSAFQRAALIGALRLPRKLEHS